MEGDGIFADERFKKMIIDPRFKHLHKVKRKVKIDKRFQQMFEDDQFKVNYKVDKYGKELNKRITDDIKKYYELDSATSSESDSSESRGKNSAKCEEHNKKQHTETNILKQQTFDPKVDYARGKVSLVSDSSSEEESGGEETNFESQLNHIWGELDAEADSTNISTNRLAVCNMDWDNLNAVDLLVLFSSFVPPGGIILNAKIYLSEFGKDRLAQEELEGPLELIKIKKKNELKNEDGEEDFGYKTEIVRQYQLNRLRYYYAVLECDSVYTADKIYRECDGLEYERTATRIDLRFISDDISFHDNNCIDECSELPGDNNYKPRNFITTALQHSKVELTWDETPLFRRELSNKLCTSNFEEISENDIRKIISFSSEDEENEEVNNIVNTKTSSNENKTYIDKYKQLLVETNNKEWEEKDQFEKEFSWNVIEESHELTSQACNSEKIKKKRKANDLKKKIKHNVENEKLLSLLVEDVDPDKKSKNHYKLENLITNHAKGSKRRKLELEAHDGFKINVNDSRFVSLYGSHNFNIDPTNPHFKKTNAMEELIKEKFRRVKNVDVNHIQ